MSKDPKKKLLKKYILLEEEKLQQSYHQILEFLENYKQQFQGAVIALSGGIDSTVVAKLATEVFGAESVLGLVMPSKVNKDGNMSDAEHVASDFLSLKNYYKIEIEPVIDTFFNQAEDLEPEDLALANTYARVRADYSYAYANQNDLIVLGTGNLSELMIGYFTKYGDGAVDCLPIGDLYKNQVRQLAELLDVPRHIINKPPTAGLWSGQTDKDELGVDYSTLDLILELYVRDKKIVNKEKLVNRLQINMKLFEDIISMHKSSFHKRKLPPIAKLNF